ncbi:unnamed protein product [Blepharisma stoltei]|uniref:Uncharacterized protein n=1 Tax=Blepharisma stoltei TaxID=1481888 RepID=A0AAU9JUG6_9CILI|nr:unnamed protein product [Blepharisma stoltei]
MSSLENLKSQGPSEIEGIQSLLQVAEELLFSFPLPTEIVTKYDTMRSKYFQKLGISSSSSHIWKLQRDAHAKSRSKSPIPDRNTKSFDSIKIELESRIDKSYLLISKYKKLVEDVMYYQDKLNLQAGLIAERSNRPRSQSPLKSSLGSNQYDQTLRVFDLGSSSLQKYQIIESEEESSFEALKQQFNEKSRQSFIIMDDVRNLFAKQVATISGYEDSIKKLSKRENSDREDFENKFNLLALKYNQTKEEYEVKIKQLREEAYSTRQNYLEEARKSHIKDIEKLMQERDQYKEKAEQLQQQYDSVKFSLMEEINRINYSYSKEIETLTQKCTHEIKDNDSAYQSEINALKNKQKIREEELLHKLESIAEEDAKTIQALRESLDNHIRSEEELKTMIRTIGEISHGIYWKYGRSDEEQANRRENIYEKFSYYGVCEFTDVLVEIDYLGYLIGKLSTDNNWLVDRLGDFGKENDTLKAAIYSKTPTPKKIREDAHRKTHSELKSTSKAMKEFEDARDKLIEKMNISEGPRKEPSSVTKLYKKYIGDRGRSQSFVRGE